MTRSSRGLHFDIDPSVVFQLGADLITDEVQALIELVKNCYDADASYATIELDARATAKDALAESMFPDAKGYVVISDNGNGMDLSSLKSGWLVISKSAKRKLKAAGKTTKSGRTPLGDKGLGRLGSQRLGMNVEIVTKAARDSKAQHVGFSWEEFSKASTLTEVPVYRSRFHPTRRRGTTVIVSGLVNPDRWEDETVKPELEQRLASLISPFGGVEGFEVLFTVNGIAIDLVSITKKIRQEADVSFDVIFDGTSLEVTGKIKRRHLRPAGAPGDLFQEVCEEDDGEALYRYLAQRPQLPNLRRAHSSAWYLQCCQVFALEDLDKPGLDENGELANPGPFTAEIDSFELSSEREAEQTAFSRRGEYKRYVKELAGVRVYRDGFGVKVETDFLKLGQAWTSGRSWYGLKPGNTLGYIAISARDNPDLIETTDREGFKETSHYQTFRQLLDRVVQTTGELLNALRRSTLEYVREIQQERGGIAGSLSPEALAEQIGCELETASEQRSTLKREQRHVASAERELAEVATQTNNSLFSSDPELAKARKILDRLQTSVRKARTGLESAASVLDQIETLRSRYSVLISHIARFDERLSQAYEAMGLGLSAEALAHEIRFIADGLADRAATIARFLKSSNTTEPKMAAFVRHVRSSVAALRRQLAHLDPGLKYARERREHFSLFDLLKEFCEHHRSRWREQKLSIVVKQIDRNQFALDVNRGKLTQILDNLVLNSEYWLKEDIRLGRLREGIIKIETRVPYLWVSDNGRGIDPSVESSLFEPFVTTKRDGRGLGLFIVRELLASEGCAIDLYHERNTAERYYAFELDLSGMIAGADDG